MSVVWWHECDIGRASLNVGEDCVHCGLTYAQAAVDAAWASAMQLIRGQGGDPDEMLKRAAANVDAWHAKVGWPPPTAPTPAEMPCARCGIAIPYRADEVDPTCNAMDCCRACEASAEVDSLEDVITSLMGRITTLTAERDALKVHLARAEHDIVSCGRHDDYQPVGECGVMVPPLPGRDYVILTLKAENEPLTRLGERATGLLREGEWQVLRMCRFCSEDQEDGHADDCRLAAFLAAPVKP